MKKKIRELFPELTAAVLLTVLSAYLLGGDVWTFWTWWLLALFMGMVAMPVTGRLFGGFEDRAGFFKGTCHCGYRISHLASGSGGNPYFYSSSVCRSICGCWHFMCSTFHVQLKHGIECYPSGRCS